MPNRSIPLYVSIVTFAVGLSIPITYFYLKGKEASNNNDSTLSASLSASDNCQHHSFRLKGYQYTRPLLFAEEECESKDLKDIKSQVSTKIEQLKSSGIISSASFYLRIFQNGEWTGCNVDEKFNPSSLMKVPVMMTILKMADKSPEFLEKKIKFIPDGTYIPNQSFHDKEIEPNREYSVKELLSYMILYSDNNATHLLNQKMDLSVFKKMFTDIGIQEPNVSDKFYQISSRDYSNFLKVLFNASYISKDMSDFAISLLAKSDFKDGLLSGVPENIIVAHKFGEGGTNDQPELHESAIFYTSGRPYLLTVMTRGNNLHNLPSVLKDISSSVYSYMTK